MLFAPGDARLDLGAVRALAAVAQILAPTDFPIIVEGHADKYAGRFRDGEDVQLAWKKNVATLVSH